MRVHALNVLDDALGDRNGGKAGQLHAAMGIIAAEGPRRGAADPRAACDGAVGTGQGTARRGRGERVVARLRRRRADPARSRHQGDDPAVQFASADRRSRRVWFESGGGRARFPSAGGCCERRCHPPRRPSRRAARIVVIEARFYNDIADHLLRGVNAALEANGGSSRVITVPGIAELPAALSFAVRAGRTFARQPGVPPAMSCWVPPLRARPITTTIFVAKRCACVQDIAVEGLLAVGNGILTVHNIDQAMAPLPHRRHRPRRPSRTRLPADDRAQERAGFRLRMSDETTLDHGKRDRPAPIVGRAPCGRAGALPIRNDVGFGGHDHPGLSRLRCRAHGARR